MGDRVLQAFGEPSFDRAERLVASVGGALFFVTVKAFVDGKISTSFKFRFFEIKSHDTPFFNNATNATIISQKK